MSIFTHEPMTNHHGEGLLAQMSDTLHVWRERYRMRQELAHWTERDLHDIGMSPSEVAFELEKPFWRA
jgi:uncharacterized protein YjiS (DUF1127 family)